MTVIAYDDAGGVIAARPLVWMLRAIGQPSALLGWGRPGRGADRSSLASALRSGVTAETEAIDWPAHLLASIDEVATFTGVLIDARERARFDALEEPIDPRAGHIPGARNFPCREGTWMPRAAFCRSRQLHDRFVASGITSTLLRSSRTAGRE